MQNNKINLSKPQKSPTSTHYQLDNTYNVDHNPNKERRKQKRLEKKLSTAQSTDGIDPLYNSEDVANEIIKKIKNKDKQFKKEQRTKALNIINKENYQDAPVR